MTDTTRNLSEPPHLPGASGDWSVTIAPQPIRILVTYQSDTSNLVQTDEGGFRDIFITTISEPEDTEDTEEDDPTNTSRRNTILISKNHATNEKAN